MQLKEIDESTNRFLHSRTINIMKVYESIEK
jgi:hypothetical protein